MLLGVYSDPKPTISERIGVGEGGGGKGKGEEVRGWGRRGPGAKAGKARTRDQKSRARAGPAAVRSDRDKRREARGLKAGAMRASGGARQPLARRTESSAAATATPEPREPLGERRARTHEPGGRATESADRRRRNRRLAEKERRGKAKTVENDLEGSEKRSGRRKETDER